ncbi:FMN-binding domain protein [Thioalkalivibrio sulfidiphilus HL-EbGr7]|uniref:FMN-binding domain protein n=1 Tax=Thioalkalivibrio sulfidiphilus (strain HL-EbGR7) TaxID=396588 RepID=B8GM52_THISH|nr:NosR/NirI family protein [Thioalkalivibrio sulfidiphilus]ACL73639.1 FMN-binding domain protein [Thioalkalivibrio sulfidiphilus HL-EbGr7]
MPACAALAGLLLVIGILLASPAHGEISPFFPEADRLGDPTGDPPAIPVFRGDEQIGLLFETRHVTPIPAYSGLPVNMLVGLDMKGEITGVRVIEHSEPIMLVGIPESRLADFVNQYVTRTVSDRVRVGLSPRQREGYTYVDAVSGATVTVVVMGESIMRGARMMAVAHGLVAPGAGAAEPARVRTGDFEPADWETLLSTGAVAHRHLTRGEVDAAFVGTEAEHVDRAPPGAEEETFIHLYAAYLNAPTVGRNLLGEALHRQLMERLAEGEHAIILMAEGIYSFKGSGFVRGGIFDRIQLLQAERAFQFRDTDLIRAPRLALDGVPRFGEREIFVVRAEHGFDPGRPWEIELLVRRQVGALDSAFVNFSLEYLPPRAFFDYPEPPPQLAHEDRPLWISVWEDRVMQIVVLSAGLLLLTFILMFQDVLARRPRLLNHIRHGFLIYTVVFIGWYALAQLSVVNIFSFTHALFTDFQWGTFLMDPMMFMLWSFVAVTLLLWGRGVYCGWLCPFGAMQELINEVSRKFRVPQYELPWAVHERLWSIKYLILLGLFGISLHSMASAEIYAEVEPFKTAVTMRFQREWGFVLYAGILLAISVVNRKFFCRYLCPLGAGLAIPARIRLFDWLKRHKECGSPCQICANECEVKAIHPDGRINANECHYCLDCQVTYWNDRKCPPMVARRKRREKAATISLARLGNGLPDTQAEQKTSQAPTGP